MRTNTHWLFAFLLSVVAPCQAADWVTYRADAARTGFTPGSLPKTLSCRWIHRPSNLPQPAWPRSDRMPFDRAFHVVTGDGKVFFGSSADGAVYALDAGSGQVVWKYQTDAPVRFAPTVWRDRLLVASDDGYLYALAMRDGQLLWKQRGGPDGSSVLGNQKLISKWPARGGPVVVGDVVYFAAGIWPSDGLYLFGLAADTGKPLWVNDRTGSIYMPQPHGGANAESGASAQGYLVAGVDHLFVPTGRAVPASFDLLTGELQYFHLQKYGHDGGAPTMAIGDMFFNSGLSFNSSSGERLSSVGVGQLAATGSGLVRGAEGKVFAYEWSDEEKFDRKGNPVQVKTLKPVCEVENVAAGSALIVAGEMVVTGGRDRVDMVDVGQERSVWSAAVDGVVLGLAAANEMLLISTDQGAIYCFDASKTKSSPTTTVDWNARPYGENRAVAAAAEEIIEKTGVTEGYCLDLGCGDGSLAYELAKRTRLQIWAVDDDPALVEIARQKLAAAGLYGNRVTVQQRDTDRTGYPKYFANLIVSARSLDSDSVVEPTEEAARLQRPYGGTICIGKAGSMRVQQRGKLAGAGSWTHQYADAANTLCSDDTLIAGRLSMLWFRDFDFDVPQRHGRAPAPLYHEGRLFHQGLHGVVAVDAYNGRQLWRYHIEDLLTAYDGDELMGTAGTGGNFCVDGDSVYVRDEDRVVQLSASDGELLREFRLPPTPEGESLPWGYVACEDGILYGSTANPAHTVTFRYRATTGDLSRLLTESTSLFAMDADTGQLLWQYRAADSIRHNAIAIGEGRVFLIDRPMAQHDRFKESADRSQEMGRMLALDARTGKEFWRIEEDIYGTTLAVSKKHGAVLMGYQPTSFRLDSELGGRLTVFRSNDGQKLWEVKTDYKSRPMINDRTIYVQGGAWDLVTGEPHSFNFQRSYGCGILAGSRHLCVFRSATLGYFDFGRNERVENYGGMRPGCWINALPAGGLVLVPDASAGCRCSYLNRSWIALESSGTSND